MMVALSSGALHVFTALLLAHVLADFVFQTQWSLRNEAHVLVFLLHIAAVFGFTTAALGGVWELAVPVALLHLVIEALRVWALPAAWRRRLPVFATAQLAHIAVLAGVALAYPAAFDRGLWAPFADVLLAPAIVMTGLVLAVPAGGQIVGALMARYAGAIDEDSLPQAGQIIGLLERGLIVLLVFTGQAAGVGFLIAAKSILRFDTAAQGQKAGEYVIIGTLASFGWALALAFGTQAVLEILPRNP